MPSQKTLILSVVISLLAHALLISATGLFNLRPGTPNQETTITVNLTKAREVRSRLANSVNKEKELPASPQEAEAESNIVEQESIVLDSEDQRFAPYLKKIKQKIENSWSYPPEAFTAKKEGVSTVSFSLDRSGRLVESKIIESSGHEILDQATINVINRVAPYEPFPRSINLSRLHIQASFQYRLLP